MAFNVRVSLTLKVIILSLLFVYCNALLEFSLAKVAYWSILSLIFELCFSQKCWTLLVMMHDSTPFNGSRFLGLLTIHPWPALVSSVYAPPTPICNLSFPLNRMEQLLRRRDLKWKYTFFSLFDEQNNWRFLLFLIIFTITTRSLIFLAHFMSISCLPSPVSWGHDFIKVTFFLSDLSEKVCWGSLGRVIKKSIGSVAALLGKVPQQRDLTRAKLTLDTFFWD